MNIHYLQHVPIENPGCVLTWAHNHGHTVTETRLYQGDPFPRQEDFDWLFILGGPMNIYEEDKYPWLIPEKRFIRETIVSGKTVVGLCLGGQLIADVMGGKVTKNPNPEIGWFPVRLTEKARASKLFSFFPSDPVVFEWHGDTFSIPPEAERIAGSAACENQAFIWEDRVFAFQYHLEMTESIIRDLAADCADEMIPGPYVQSAQQVLSHTELVRQGNAWMSEFLSRLEAAQNCGK